MNEFLTAEASLIAIARMERRYAASLDADQRRRFEIRMRADAEFAAIVYEAMCLAHDGAAIGAAISTDTEGAMEELPDEHLRKARSAAFHAAAIHRWHALKSTE